jgi:conjugative transfer region protein (TIGR03748 family)
MTFKSLLGLMLVAVTSLGGTHVLAQTTKPDGGQVQVGRYTTQAAAPTETLADPLSVFAQLSYPRQTVNSVGDALAHTLVRTGFRMVPHEALDDVARNFLNLPLPESQRRMGPHRVSDLLKTLLGPAWQLHSDPLTRQVWFTRSTIAGPAAPPTPKAEVKPDVPTDAIPAASGGRPLAASSQQDPFRSP